jgi:hypothetical protein
MKSKAITTTRFNNETFQQNKNYIKKSNINGCIYGTPIKIKSNVPLETTVYVIEMNNEKNKIEGIGLINNRLILDKSHRIYNDMDYNRYIYKGSRRLDTSSINDEYYKRVIYVLEQLLFKGGRHCKRAQGITNLADWIINNKHEFNFIKCMDDMFNKYVFKQ